MAKGALPAAIAGVRGLSIALLTNPIGAIVAGVAVAGLLLIKYWKPVSAFFKGVFKGIAEGLGPIAGAIGSVFAPVAGIFKTVIGWVSKLFGPVETTADGLAKAGSAGAAAGRIIAGALKLIFAPITLVINLVTTLWKGIRAVFSWSPTKTLKAAWSGLGNLVGALISGVKDIAARGWDHIKTILSWSPIGLVGRAWNGLGGLISRVTGGAKQETGKAWRGIKAIVAWSPNGTLRQAWASAGDVLKSAFRKMFGVASDGMKKVAGAITKPIEGLAKSFGVKLNLGGDGKPKPKAPPPSDGPPPPAAPPPNAPMAYDVTPLNANEIDFDDYATLSSGSAGMTFGDVTLHINGANQSTREIADEVMRRLENLGSGAHYDGD
jgi:phage-related protein